MAGVSTAVSSGTRSERWSLRADSESRASRASHFDIQLPRSRTQQCGSAENVYRISPCRTEENRARSVSRDQAISGVRSWRQELISRRLRPGEKRGELGTTLGTKVACHATGVGPENGRSRCTRLRHLLRRRSRRNVRSEMRRSERFRLASAVGAAATNPLAGSEGKDSWTHWSEVYVDRTLVVNLCNHVKVPKRFLRLNGDASRGLQPPAGCEYPAFRWHDEGDCEGFAG